MVHLLFGENTFALHEEKQRRITDYLSTNDSLGLERLDGEEVSVSGLRDALLQLPFLVSKKLVVLTNAFAAKATIDALISLLDQIPDEVDVVLIDPRPDKRTKLFKLLHTSGCTHEYQSLKGQSLVSWATAYAKSHASVLSAQNAQYLIDRVGIDQMMLAREIEKLSYASEITMDDIDELTEKSLTATVFDLLEAVFSGALKKALNIYETLLSSKTDPSEILGLIAWQLHVFALVKYAGAGGDTGLHPFVVSKAVRIVDGWNAQDIKHYVELALQADESIKTGKANPDDALRVLFLGLSKRAQ